MLLDRYYSTEQPIPKDQAHRICRARTREERAAVDAVLAEFFDLEDGVYRQKRVDIEIARYMESEPDREAKRENERERQRRTRERRKALFDLLRRHGIVPKYDVPMSELQALADRVKSLPVTPPVTQPVTQPVTPVTCDATATQTPDTIPIHQIQERARPARAPDMGADDPPAASPAIAACRALIASGVPSTEVNAAHPTLAALCECGATVEEFSAAGAKAKGRSNPFAYALAVVKGQREDAARVTTLPPRRGAHGGFAAKDYRAGVNPDGSFS
jgi:uncharacterized protein YdaU (DUF1376 family)